MSNVISNTTPAVVTDPVPLDDNTANGASDVLVQEGAISNAEVQGLIQTLQEQFADGIQPNDFLVLLSATIGLVKEQTSLSDGQQSTLVSEIIKQVLAGVVKDEAQQQEIINNLPAVLGVIQGLLDTVSGAGEEDENDAAAGGCCGGILSFLPWKA